ncbi:hypothetical protein LXL04_013663 [Taraxacum kok-saghyz]
MKSRSGIYGIGMESRSGIHWDRLESRMGSILGIGDLDESERFSGDWERHDWERRSRLSLLTKNTARSFLLGSLPFHSEESSPCGRLLPCVFFLYRHNRFSFRPLCFRRCSSFFSPTPSLFFRRRPTAAAVKVSLFSSLFNSSTVRLKFH